jgi:hypothetical protein
MIRKIIPGIHHWKTWYEEIGSDVHSFYLAQIDPGAVIDPRVPQEGLSWFEGHRRPENAFLTNRLHFRDVSAFTGAFSTAVWCHQAGLHEFSRADGVRGFAHGELLPGGLQALKVGAICPEETAYFLPSAGGVIFLGDAVMRFNEDLTFPPDELLGDDPKGVKKGLKESLGALLDLEFDHLLFAHGEPLIGGARQELKKFLAQ